MDERNNETTPETNFEDPNAGHSSEGADIYGDAETVEVADLELPAEQTEKVSGQENESVSEENLTEVSAEQATDLKADKPVSEAQPSEAESIISAEVPHRHNGEAVSTEETAADVVPEVESTVVTRRSLLGGAKSSIPSANHADGTPADSTVGKQAVSAESASAEDASQSVIRRSIGLAQSAAASQDSFASEVATASAAGASSAADSISNPEETRVQPAIPTREKARTNPVVVGPPAGGLETETVIPAKLPGRFVAHAWTFLLALLLLPVAWYLLTDGITHIALSGVNPWESETLPWIGLIEVFGGAIVAGILLFSTRWSTVGVFLSSLILTVVGIPFLVVPKWTHELLQPAVDALYGWNLFGKAVAHHLLWSGFTGLLFIAGILGLAVWLGAHGARRKGTNRGLLQATVEQRNHGAQGNSFPAL